MFLLLIFERIRLALLSTAAAPLLPSAFVASSGWGSCRRRGEKSQRDEQYYQRDGLHRAATLC